MESKNFDGSLKEALMGLQHYVDLQIKYNKLLIAKRMGEISSLLVIFMVLLILFSFALFFLSFWFVDWFAAHIGHRYYGNLIVFGFYLLLGILIIIFREPLIFSPIRKMFTNIFSGDDDENGLAYSSKEALNLQLKNYREILNDEGEELKTKLENLGKVMTLPNIIQSAGRSIYNSFVTTSNVARFTYNLVKRLRGRSSKKRKKYKNKGDSNQIEENID